MKLEDFTKEELIAAIRCSRKISGAAEKDLLPELKMLRIKKAEAEWRKAADECLAAVRWAEAIGNEMHRKYGNAGVKEWSEDERKNFVDAVDASEAADEAERAAWRKLQELEKQLIKE